MNKYFSKILLIASLSLLLFEAVPTLAQETQEEVRAYNISISTGQESINAIEGEVVIPNQDIEIALVDFSNSVVSLWVESPQAKAEGNIHFSGAIPGGASGKLQLFTLYIRSKSRQPVAGNFYVQNLKALKNDGVGTLVELENQVFDFSFDPENFIAQGQTEEQSLPTDSTPPESFQVNIFFDPDIEGGKWVASFITQDKQSGLSHYEVWETKNPDSEKETWERVEGLYVLKDQSKKSYLYVRAVDNQGNIRLEYVLPESESKVSKSNTYTLAALVVILIIGSFRWYLRRKKNKQENENLDTLQKSEN